MSVRVTYHREGGSWWADSPDLDGFVAVGAELPEVRELVKEGLPFYLGQDSVELEEEAPWDSGVVVTYRPQGQWSGCALHGTAIEANVSIHALSSAWLYSARTSTESTKTRETAAAS